MQPLGHALRQELSHEGNKAIRVCTVMPMAHGTDFQKEKFLKPLLNGEKRICYSMTEKAAGADATGMQTRAVKDGNENYVLNGEKCYITFAPVADYILVFARIGDISGGTRNLSAFIVDAKTPGVTIGKNERKLGLNGIPNAPVYLENVKVPIENRVGEPAQDHDPTKC